MLADWCSGIWYMIYVCWVAVQETDENPSSNSFSDQSSFSKPQSTGSSSIQVLGKWSDEVIPEVTRQIMIYRKDGTSFMETTFMDGGDRKPTVTKLLERNTSDGLRFEEVEKSDYGDHYLITPEENLQIRDNDGLIKVLR